MASEDLFKESEELMVVDETPGKDPSSEHVEQSNNDQPTEDITEEEMERETPTEDLEEEELEPVEEHDNDGECFNSSNSSIE